jgi:hypothetical protein
LGKLGLVGLGPEFIVTVNGVSVNSSFGLDSSYAMSVAICVPKQFSKIPIKFLPLDPTVERRNILV